ncbi:MAG TPA: hypothetical protein VGS61_06705, partial [Acidimicrobiales bacterium]|nr:hypothetical protein [Acidimicrobiales bacterium]
SVLRNYAAGPGIRVEEVPFDPATGRLDLGVLRSAVSAGDVTGLLADVPNGFGHLDESLPELKGVLGEALLVVSADPLALTVLEAPGAYGADVVVGEGQAFGTALSFGGPYLGLFACALEQVRRLPGRIVGETVDAEGRRAFVTTLRAREQDIRREKATSNVCTNQTLMAVAAAVQLGWLGTQGLREVATRSARGAHYLFERVSALPGVSAVSRAPFLREFCVSVPGPADEALAAMADRGFLAGLSVTSLTGGADASLEDDEGAILVAVTERRTRAELDGYAEALAEVIK